MTTDQNAGRDGMPSGATPGQGSSGARRSSRATSRPTPRTAGAPTRRSGQKLTNNLTSSSGQRRAAGRPAGQRPSGQRPSGQRAARPAGAQRRVAAAGAAKTQRVAAQGAPQRYQPKSGYHGTPARSKRSFSLNKGGLSGLPMPMLIGAGVGVLAVILLVHYLLRPSITVNGKKATVWAGATIEKLLDAKLAEPKAGNKMAVDGSLLEEGGGERCTATINGEPASLDTKVPRGAEVSIGDGGDTTEEADVSQETLPHGTANADKSAGGYYAGSIHIISEGKDGLQETRTGKESGKTVTEVLEQPEDAGYSVYTAQPDDKVICLTFDDGPWPETTDGILDVLEQNNAKATFFTIGKQIGESTEQTEATKRASEMGCQVCTHSWDHAAGSGQGVNLTFMSADEQVKEIQQGYKAIADVLGAEPAHVTRCPGGNFYDTMVDTLAPYIDAEIGWDVDTEDWSLPGVDHIVEMLMSVKPGQVVLMHDGGGDRSQTMEALKQALPKLAEQGFKFITVNEMLAYGKPSGTVSADSGSTGTKDATGTTTDAGTGTTTDATDTTTTTDASGATSTTDATGTSTTTTTDATGTTTTDATTTGTTGTSTGMGVTTTADGAVSVG